MAWNFWNSLQACRDGAASIRLGGASIRLFPVIDSCSTDESLERTFDKIRLVNEKINQTMYDANKSALKEVEEKLNER